METNLVGQNLGIYRIVEQIGRGGMAMVYKAFEPALERYVAIKVLPQYFAHDPSFVARFEREAKAVAKLDHPNILPIYGFGQDEGLSYIVMRYVQAGTLKEMLGAPLGLNDIVNILEQVGRALDYAHQQGVIHRDVKPSNVLMAEGKWALLTDFGLARMLESSSQITKSGMGVGTPAYMSPEQGQGKKVDSRSDIYSLGVVLYEMATGQVPYDAETPMAIVLKHITAPLPMPSHVNPDLAEPVEQVILKVLAKDTKDRYQTSAELVDTLKQILNTGGYFAANVLPKIAEPRIDASDPTYEKDLERAYLDALSAYWLREWAAAQGLFRIVVEQKPDYQDAAEKLEEVERQIALVSLYSNAQAAMQSGDWRTAQEALEQLIATDSDFNNAAIMLEEVRKQRRLEELYDQARKLSLGERWEAVINVFMQIQALQPDYPDPEGLLILAEGENEAERRLESLALTYRNALTAMETEDWTQAIILFEHILAEDPDYPNAAALLERALGEQESLSEKPKGDDQLAHSEAGKTRQTSRRRQIIWGTTGVFVCLTLTCLGIWVLGLEDDSTVLAINSATPTIELTAMTAAVQDTQFAQVAKDSQQTEAANARLMQVVDKEPATTVTSETESATAIPTPTPIPALIFDGSGIPMALVPAGEFQMGSPVKIAFAECQEICVECDCQESRFVDAEPPHTVFLDSFYMDQYEVTNARYDACVQAGDCGPPLELESNTHTPYYGDSQYDDYPVISVNWDMANAYCRWRGSRLPTEAEWEKAARGGLDRAIYPWGNERPTCQMGLYNGANFGRCIGDTTRVGSLGANSYGLYDMAGNVLEWLADWYAVDGYQAHDLENPTGPASGDQRVIRGGSWYNFVDFLQVAVRGKMEPGETRSFLGFRCARSLKDMDSSAEQDSDPRNAPAVWQLTVGSGKNSQPSVSPDGNYIVFISDQDGNREIYTMNTDGTDQSKLTSDPKISNDLPSYSPDGRYVIFGGLKGNKEDIYIIEVSGGQTYNLTNTPNVSEGRPRFLADAQDHYVITYDSNETGNWEIYTAEVYLDGLLNISQVTDDPLLFHRLPSFIPPGDTILFRGEDSKTAPASSRIYSADLKGPPIERVNPEEYMQIYPAVSRDGKWIAFVSDKDGNLEIYLQETATGIIQRLTDDPGLDGDPAFSPDGSWVVFVSDRSGGGMDIFRIVIP